MIDFKFWRWPENYRINKALEGPAITISSEPVTSVPDQQAAHRRYLVDEINKLRAADQERSRAAARRVEVSIKAIDREGEEPHEAACWLPFVDGATKIEVWVPEGDHNYTDQPVWLPVEDVVLSTYWPECVEVWVDVGEFSDEMVLAIFEAIKENSQP